MTRHTATQWVCNRCDAKATTATIPDLPPVGWRGLDTNVDMAGELTSYDDLALCGGCSDDFDDFIDDADQLIAVIDIGGDIADVIDLRSPTAAAEVAARQLHPTNADAEPFLGMVEAGDVLNQHFDAKADREQRWGRRADLIDHLTTLGPDNNETPPGWTPGEIALLLLDQLEELHKVEQAVALGYQRDVITTWADSSLDDVLAAYTGGAI